MSPKILPKNYIWTSIPKLPNEQVSGNKFIFYIFILILYIGPGNYKLNYYCHKWSPFLSLGDTFLLYPAHPFIVYIVNFPQPSDSNVHFRSKSEKIF